MNPEIKEETLYSLSLLRQSEVVTVLLLLVVFVLVTALAA